MSRTPEEDTIFRWLLAFATVALKLVLTYFLVGAAIIVLIVVVFTNKGGVGDKRYDNIPHRLEHPQ